MEGRQKKSVAVSEQTAVKPRDAFPGLKQGLRGGSAKCNDEFRPHYLQLPVKDRSAGGDFAGVGCAVIRGAALDDVADVDVLAAGTHGFDHLAQQFAGAADKGPAGAVFLRPRSLTYEDQSGFGGALTEDNGIAARTERADVAALKPLLQCLQLPGFVVAVQFGYLRHT